MVSPGCQPSQERCRWAGQWHMGSSKGAVEQEHGAGTSALHP